MSVTEIFIFYINFIYNVIGPWWFSSRRLSSYKVGHQSSVCFSTCESFICKSRDLYLCVPTQGNCRWLRVFSLVIYKIAFWLSFLFDRPISGIFSCKWISLLHGSSLVIALCTLISKLVAYLCSDAKWFLWVPNPLPKYVIALFCVAFNWYFKVRDFGLYNHAIYHTAL